jgi:hypothetical protein
LNPTYPPHTTVQLKTSNKTLTLDITKISAHHAKTKRP